MSPVIEELKALLPDTAFSIESVKREGVEDSGEYEVYQEEVTIWVGAMPRAIGKTADEALRNLKSSIDDWRICQK